MKTLLAPTCIPAFIICLLAAGSAAAQTKTGALPAPNGAPATAPATASDEAPKRKAWKRKAELSYVATAGNATTTTAKVGAEVQYQPGVWTTLFRAAYLTNTTTAKGRQERIDGLARTERAVSQRLELFGQMAYLQNTFAGITNSVYPMGGLAVGIVDRQSHTVKARVGLGYGQENRLRSPDLSFATADAETACRWSWSKTAEFRQDATFTKNLARSADWRIANVTSVTAALTSLFGLKLSHTVNYQNRPVVGYERTDVITSASLVATF